MNIDSAVSARNLGKLYNRGASKTRHESLRGMVWDGMRRMLKPGRNRAGNFWALSNVSFDIKEGENIGLIGLNGAGKSTLLKVLSRIIEPTTGSARIRGRVGALLEVGTGFHPELTGRENVFLAGSILGMSKAEVARKFDDIVAFSDVSAFIDMPVKRYSSGMYVRLGFAVTAHLNPDVLFLDEVLAVGDLAFQRKCIDYAKALQRRKATILFVSHNMFSIKNMCERVVYMRSGSVAFDGSVDAGISQYERDCRLAASNSSAGAPNDWAANIVSFELQDRDGSDRTIFDMGSALTLRLELAVRIELDELSAVVSITRSDGVRCTTFDSSQANVSLPRFGRAIVEIRVPELRLAADMYAIDVSLYSKGGVQAVGSQTVTTFHVRDERFSSALGVLEMENHWNVVSSDSVGARQFSYVDLAAQD